MHNFFTTLSAVIFVFAQSTVVDANSDFEEGDLLASALSAVENDDWVTADHLSDQMSDPVGKDMIVWSRLRAGEGEWWEYKDFLARNPDWPGLKRLRRVAEGVIDATDTAKNIRTFFAVQAPQTGSGALALARALKQQGRTAEARSEIIRAWKDLSLSKVDQQNLLSDYKGVVERHHAARLENLLWKGWKVEAGRMFDLVPKAQASLAKARIGLQRAAPNVDTLIDTIPAVLANDPGLAFDRFQWRMKKDRWDEAHDLLVERTGGTKKMGRPEEWAPRRRGFARRSMRAGEHNIAYLLASQHELDDGANYADLEWLSGYISLVHLNAPKQALVHFNKFAKAVKTPISFGRAGYWQGRTYEVLKQYSQAEASYRFAAQYQTSFYGQLAAERMQMDADVDLNGLELVESWKQSSFVNSEVLRAATLLNNAQEVVMVRWFLTHMAETMDRADLLKLASFAIELDQPFVALGIAKEAAKRGIVLPAAYYPVTELAGYSADVVPEMAMSIARRESELSPGAISSAGARGLMQLMPATARAVADELDMEYSKARLTSDWRYNATLGTAYLAGLIDIYEGSYVLAFAAYNAGPNRADEWIELYGDPRDPLVDAVDWVEHIPFRETRNYVMRVIESLHVYRARISGQASKVQLLADLTRG